MSDDYTDDCYTETETNYDEQELNDDYDTETGSTDPNFDPFDTNEYSQNDSQSDENDSDSENDFTQNERYKDIRWFLKQNIIDLRSLKYGVKEETHNIPELKEYIQRQIICFFRSEAESWENLLNRNTFWNEGI